MGADWLLCDKGIPRHQRAHVIDELFQAIRGYLNRDRSTFLNIFIKST